MMSDFEPISTDFMVIVLAGDHVFEGDHFAENLLFELLGGSLTCASIGNLTVGHTLSI